MLAIAIRCAEVAELLIDAGADVRATDAKGKIIGLSKLPRIVNVGSLTIKAVKKKGGRMLLKVDGTATTFRFLAPSETTKKKKKSGRQAALASRRVRNDA